MTATRANMDELRSPRVSPLVGMGVQIALLQDSLDRFRECWQEFVTQPFVTSEPDDQVVYAGDENE